MADDRDAEIFQIFGRQVRQKVALDSVVAERRFVLSETEVLEPGCDVHGRLHSARWDTRLRLVVCKASSNWTRDARRPGVPLERSLPLNPNSAFSRFAPVHVPDCKGTEDQFDPIVEPFGNDRYLRIAAVRWSSLRGGHQLHLVRKIGRALGRPRHSTTLLSTVEDSLFNLKRILARKDWLSVRKEALVSSSDVSGVCVTQPPLRLLADPGLVLVRGPDLWASRMRERVGSMSVKLTDAQLVMLGAARAAREPSLDRARQDEGRGSRQGQRKAGEARLGPRGSARAGTPVCAERRRRAKLCDERTRPG